MIDDKKFKIIDKKLKKTTEGYGVPYKSNFFENRETTIAWNADKSDFFYITHRNLYKIIIIYRRDING